MLADTPPQQQHHITLQQAAADPCDRSSTQLSGDLLLYSDLRGLILGHMLHSHAHGGNAVTACCPAEKADTGHCTVDMQTSALGNEEEQLVSLLLSKGAAESALADEMGRLKVQEEVCILGVATHIPPMLPLPATHLQLHGMLQNYSQQKPHS